MQSSHSDCRSSSAFGGRCLTLGKYLTPSQSQMDHIRTPHFLQASTGHKSKIIHDGGGTIRILPLKYILIRNTAAEKCFKITIKCTVLNQLDSHVVAHFRSYLNANTQIWFANLEEFFGGRCENLLKA